MTRREAKARGQYHYEGGKPCPRCGATKRYTRCARCVACVIREATARNQEKAIEARRQREEPSDAREVAADRAWHHARVL